MGEPVIGGSLLGLSVVEIGSGVSSAVAGMLLAEHGADVVRWAPEGTPQPVAEAGPLAWHRGKRRMVPGPGGDLDVLDALVRRADVCIIGPGEPVLADPPQILAERHPGTVFLAMPPSCDGSWPGRGESNELLCAVSGLAMRQSSQAGGPIDPVHPHVGYVHGAWAATCAVAALVERTRSGRGQLVTVTGVHAALVAGTATFVIDPDADPEPPPAGPGGTNPLYTRYRCADGRWLFLGGLTGKFQRAALDVLDLADLAADPRLGGVLDRVVLPGNRDWVRDRVARRFETRARAEWLARLAAADCPAGPVEEPGGWLDHPQIRQSGLRQEIDHPELGRVVVPGPSLEFTATPAAGRGPERQVPTAPPLGDPEPRAVGTRTSAGAPVGPLAGLRVLDLGTVLAGPLSGCLLAELGADVVKIEPPAGDPFRTRGFVYNRGMRSLAVDLRSAEGRAVFGRLAASADVMIDNFRPGVLERLGIDHATLSATNRGLVSFSLTGFGDRGPLAGRPGFDPILQAASGMMVAQGGGGEPVFLTVAVNDIAAAVMGALAACLGVLHRCRGGVGQAVRSSLAAMSVFMQSGELVDYPGRPPARRGGDDFRGPGPFDRYYATADGWVRVQAAHIAEPDVKALVAGRWSTVEALARLRAGGVAAVPARRAADLPDDPALRALDAFHVHRRADGRPYFTPGRVADFGRTQQHRTLVAPGLGEHSRELLAEAGLTGAEIDALVADGVVVSGDPFALDELLAYR